MGVQKAVRSGMITPKVCGFLILGLLFFIWPIGGTISVRDISIFLLFFIFGHMAWRARPYFSTPKELAEPIVILAVLTAWIILQAIFISTETVRSLQEITGQWLKPLVVFLTGGMVGISTGPNEPGWGKSFFNSRNILTLLFSILLFHILYVDLSAVYIFARLPSCPQGLEDSPPAWTKAADLSHLLLSMLCVEIYFRGRCHKCIRVNNSFLFLSLPLTLFSIYLEAVRNGTVIAMLILLAFVILYFLKNIDAARKPAFLATAVVLTVLFGYTSFKTEHTWGTFLETVPLALDTQHNRGWLNPIKYPYPKLKNGETVHGSNYERIAWFKEGVILVYENPLGIGFGRKAFGQALKKKYGAESIRTTHSHSGIVDLAVGAGLPGFLLWMLFIVSVMYRSMKEFWTQESYCGLLLLFIAAHFTLRSIVDSVIRDHMLEMFMFFVGLLYVLMLKSSHNPKVSGSNPLPATK